MAGPHVPYESLIKLAQILVAEQRLDKNLRQVPDMACAALSCGGHRWA